MKPRALLLALPLALAACTADNASVQIQALCFPSSDCTFGSTCDAQLIGNPVVDPSATSFTLVLQVANGVSNNANPQTGAVNTHDAHIEEAIVAGVTQPISSQLVPAEGTAVISVTVIPPVVGAVDVKVHGHFDDGTTFTTGPFRIFVEPGAVGACPSGESACPGLGQAPFTCF